jgi:hypothetical protein
MRTLSSFALLVSLLSLTKNIHGQSPQLLTAVRVSAVVTTSSTGIYVYSYEVTNPPQNTALIWLFGIDIATPSGGVHLSNEGLTNGPGYLQNTSQLVQRALGFGLIPVGLQGPQNWDSGLSRLGRAEWTASDAAPLIAPGQTLGIFEIDSRGLPGIRAATAQAPIDYDNLPIQPPVDESDLQRYAADLAALQSKGTARTMTIGPTAPPAIFVAADFLKTIISYKEQAVRQGWITNPGIVISLDAKLNAALMALGRGDANTAKNELEALLNELDAQKEKQLSSEASALLKFNTQYLISRIS